MKAKDRVVHKPTGNEGVLCPTIYMLLSDGDDELSFLQDGVGIPTTLNCLGGREAFDVIGEENAQADLKKCGAGRGAECCIWLTVGGQGACCERNGSMRYTLEFRTMNAKRSPSQPYPLCQFSDVSTKADADEAVRAA